MKPIFFLATAVCFSACGCDSLRFAPSEKQKQNAWLHSQTTALTADVSRAEKTSGKMQALADLAEEQSRAFLSYYGLPKKFPEAESANDVLSERSVQISRQALEDSAQRPDVWRMTNSMLDCAIGIAALLGGVYGTRAVRFLREAKTKSKALQEIIRGNEIFKKQNSEKVDSFKQSHQLQSAQTRQIVTELKQSTA